MLYNILYDWQKQFVDTYLNRKKYGIWLEMGSGKTLISIAMAEKNQCEKIIVITTKTKSIENMSHSDSFDKWLHNAGYNVYKKTGAAQKWKVTNSTENKNKQAFVINYEGLTTNRTDKFPQWLEEFVNSKSNKGIAIILDESQYIKNPTSKRAKAVNMLINIIDKKCNMYLYLLTGTPWTQGFIDLYNQLRLLGMNMTKAQFIDKFAVRGSIRGLLEWQQPIIAYKNTKELFEIVSEHSSTLLTEKLVNLPAQVFKNIELPETEEFKLIYSKYLDKKLLNKHLLKRGLPEVTSTITSKLAINMFYRNISYPNDKYFASTAASYWMRSRQLSVGFQGNADEYQYYDYSRLNKLEEFLKENAGNYILFYNYTPEYEKILEICQKLGYKVDVYNGIIKSTKHYDEYSQMNQSEQLSNTKRIIIANYASGSTGKNWQAYYKTIFFSIPLYGVYAQALKRNHRIGQKHPVYYYTFYQNNFLDKSMLKALKEGVDYNYEMFTYESKKVENEST